ncbi:hypothetical protein J6590_014137 [Homalodisca vitripennis]|nr:hypothetical protein J6590_014137 [Homalodisca vitripennis]
MEEELGFSPSDTMIGFWRKASKSPSCEHSNFDQVPFAALFTTYQVSTSCFHFDPCCLVRRVYHVNRAHFSTSNPFNSIDNTEMAKTTGLTNQLTCVTGSNMLIGRILKLNEHLKHIHCHLIKSDTLFLLYTSQGLRGRCVNLSVRDSVSQCGMQSVLPTDCSVQ